MGLILILALWQPPAWIAHAVNVAATVADVETTQRCLSAGTCKESNPLMPSNRAGAYGVSLGLVGAETIISQNMRKHHHRGWWLGPAISAGVHTGAALANGARFGW